MAKAGAAMGCRESKQAILSVIVVAALLFRPDTALAQLPPAAAAGAWMCPCPGRLPVPMGGAASCAIACMGGSGAGGVTQLMQGGAGILSGMAEQWAAQQLTNALFGNGQGDAAELQRQAAAAAEAQRQAAAAAAAAEAAKKRLLGELQGVDSGPPSSVPPGTVMVNGIPLMAGGNAAPGASVAPPPSGTEMVNGIPLMAGSNAAPGPTEASQVAVNIDGPQPTLSSGSTADAPPPDMPVGPVLGGEPPAIPSPTVSDTMGRAEAFLLDKTKEASFEMSSKAAFGDSASSVALNAGKWVEGGTGLYAMTAVVMFNASQLPEYVLSNVQAAARGDLSPAEAYGLTVQAVNRLFDFDTPVNEAIAEGPAALAESQATEGVASLAAFYLPVAEEMKEMNADVIHNLTQDLPQIARLWTTAPGAGP